LKGPHGKQTTYFTGHVFAETEQTALAALAAIA
jgi:hypothetical protein